MSFVKRSTVPFTTAADGSATVYSDDMNGFIQSIRYVYGDAATGADFTITANSTGQPIATVENAGTANIQWQPRQAIHGADGAAIATQYDKIALADEKIKIVIAAGGDTKSGTFEILVG